ncbi:MAG: CDP-alcohol phosphatidyltransferase family protein [Chthoniobacterales bacterium]
MIPTAPSPSAMRDLASADALERSYKAREVEGALDLIFYRPLGLQLAKIFAALRMTPDQVTILSTLAGVAAGHLYFYQALSLNIVGMFLHVMSNLLDNVDGQLARLTSRQSESGKIIDGIGDHIVFVSVYFHLCLRAVMAGGSEWLWLIAFAAGFSHFVQSAAAEFCRDAYARFACGRATVLPTARALQERKRTQSLGTGWRARLFLALHANYVGTQERMLPQLARLRDAALAQFQSTPAEWFADAYRKAHARLPKFSRLLGASTRMLVLFCLLLLRQPVWYFAIELTVFNALLACLRWREARASEQLLQLLSERGAS